VQGPGMSVNDAGRWRREGREPPKLRRVPGR
jgi:hypothetical protein